MLRLWLTCIALMLASAAAWGRDALPIVVEVDHGDVVYKVASERGGIDQLVTTLRAKIPNQETLNRTDAYVIASKQVSIADLQNLRSVLQKYGFPGIRFFTYWDEKARMTELSFGAKAVPYTTDPGQLQRLGEQTAGK